MLNGWPNEVHLLTERAIGGRSDPGIRRPALGLNSYDVATIDGLLVTTIERTVVDLAETLDRKSAVAVVDRALYEDRFSRTPTLTSKAAWRNQNCSIRSTLMARSTRWTFTGATSIAWGECDGRDKYFNHAYLAKRAPEQVHYDEKRREDGIRRQVSRAYALAGLDGDDPVPPATAAARPRVAAYATACAARSRASETRERAGDAPVRGSSGLVAGPAQRAARELRRYAPVAPPAHWRNPRATKRMPAHAREGGAISGIRARNDATRRARHARVARRGNCVADSSSSTLSECATHAGITARQCIVASNAS